VLESAPATRSTTDARSRIDTVCSRRISPRTVDAQVGEALAVRGPEDPRLVGVGRVVPHAPGSLAIAADPPPRDCAPSAEIDAMPHAEWCVRLPSTAGRATVPVTIEMMVQLS
jgi:hypothetical protein